MTKVVSTYLLLFSIIFCGFTVFAQTPLALKVQAAKMSKSTFQKVNLFEYEGEIAQLKEVESVLDAGQLLTIQSVDLAKAIDQKNETITLMLPTGERSKMMEIDLVLHQNLSNDFVVTTSSRNGKTVDYTPGLHYRGTVKGSSKSLAAISIFEDEVIGVIATAEAGNMVLGKTGKRADQYIFYKESDLLDEHSFECGSDLPELENHKLKSLQDAANRGGNRSMVNNCVNVYLECDYDMFQEKGSVANTVNHMTGLFNAIATLYQNETITTQVSEIFVWDTPDTYPTSSTPNALNAFRAARPNYNGDLAHLVSRGAPANGGIAWVDALCSSYGYAYSYIYSSYAAVPTYSWSVEVMTHEMGHNLGSPHTHACAWNGNNTAIDGCGPASGNSEGCDGPVPNKGTIMSYCHLVSGVGIDFNLGFGQQPGDRIRGEINNASCLSACGPPCNLTVSATSTNANNGNNGSATATAANGTPPYSYSWSNGASTATISGLAPGSYSVTVNDGGGCAATASVTILDVTPCNGNQVFLSLTLDNYPTETSWEIVNANGSVVANGGGYAQSQNNTTITDDFCLPDGCYDFNIYDTYGDGICCAYGNGGYSLTDSNGNALAAGGAFTFSESTNFCFNVTDPVAVTIFQSSNVSCNGGNDGFAIAQASGGNGSYNYAWSNGASGVTANFLSAGTYTVTATSGGQSATASVTITQPSALNVTTSATAATAGNNGTASASASGGTPGYAYAWSNGFSGANISNLAPGTYTVTATDAENCTATSSVIVENQNQAFAVNITNSGNVSCNGRNDGFAVATATGGSGSYSYSWNNGANGATNNNLTAGTYTVTASDGNQTATATVTITQPSVLTVNASSTPANNGNNGTASASANGGTFGYSYAWSNGGSGSTINNLAPATYTVTATDSNGCTATSSTTVANQNSTLAVNIVNSSNVSCFGFNNGSATAAATGGTGNYAYSWNNGANGATANNLTAGFYTVTVNDGNNTATATIVISQPSAISLSMSNTSADNGNNGTASVSASGGVGNYSYNWSNGGNSATINNLAPGTYTVTVTDGNGCQKTGATTVQDENTGGGCSEVLIDSNDFENGWGIWNDGGSDCRRSSNDSQYALGTYCVRLRDNSSASKMTTDNLSLASMQEVTVSFSYLPRSMDNQNEDFWFQVSTDGGNTYYTIVEWNLGDEFVNNVRYYDSFTMVGNFTNSTRFRFRCDASSNYDWVYIDEVVITGCKGEGLINEDKEGTLAGEIINNTPEMLPTTAVAATTSLKLFPNPATTQLTVDFVAPQETEVQLTIRDFTGRIVQQINTTGGQNQEKIDVSNLQSGYYYLQMTAGEERKTEKFVVVK